MSFKDEELTIRIIVPIIIGGMFSILVIIIIAFIYEVCKENKSEELIFVFIWLLIIFVGVWFIGRIILFVYEKLPG